jgi:hypothetical protein
VEEVLAFAGGNELRQFCAFVDRQGDFANFLHRDFLVGGEKGRVQIPEKQGKRKWIILELTREYQWMIGVQCTI